MCLGMLLNSQAELNIETEALAGQRNRILESTGNLEAKIQSSRIFDVIARLMGAKS